jgi:hypothetical protein
MYRIIASVLSHDSPQPLSVLRSLLPTLSLFQLQLRMDVPLLHLEFLALVLVFLRSKRDLVLGGLNKKKN